MRVNEDLVERRKQEAADKKRQKEMREKEHAEHRK